MRISFIVPTFNRARYLREALDSIIGQKGEDDEVLVVDDGSTDGTAEVVAATGPQVRYLRQDNAGKSVALNRGLAATTGRYVWICDDDDVLRTDALATLLPVLERDAGLGFVFGRYTRFREAPRGAREDMGTGYWPDLSSGSLARHILEDAFVMQNAALVRRSAYEAVGPFSTAMARSLDYEMFVRLAATHAAAYVDSCVFDQRKHEGARGPRSMLHAATRSDEVWQVFDKQIFLNLYRHAPLALFAAMFEGRGSASIERAALLQRGAIMFRHGCWDEAVDDLAAAADIAPGIALDPGEAAICRRGLSGKHGFADLASHSALTRLAALRRRSGVGGAMVGQLAAGTRWRLRRGASHERRYTGAALGHMLGWAGLAALLTGRERAPLGRGTVTERHTLRVSDYLPHRQIPPAVPDAGVAA